MSLKHLIGTALLGFGLNYCASVNTLDYQNHPLTQPDQQRFSELKGKADYLKSIGKREYETAEEEVLAAKNADQFYQARAEHTIFEIMQLEENDPYLNKRVDMKLSAFSMELENRAAIEKWTKEQHHTGRNYNLSGGFVSPCPALERIEALLQNQYGIDLRSYTYPFPMDSASKILAELWREGNSCN